MDTLADIRRDKTGQLLLANYFAYPMFLKYPKSGDLTINYLIANVLKDISPFGYKNARPTIKFCI